MPANMKMEFLTDRTSCLKLTDLLKQEFLEKASEVFKKGTSDAKILLEEKNNHMHNLSVKSVSSLMRWTGLKKS